MLPIGGVKEKVLGAHRVGIRNVILPKRNEYDLEDLPKELREEMHFEFVENADEVVRYALTDDIVAPPEWDNVDAPKVTPLPEAAAKGA